MDELNGYDLTTENRGLLSSLLSGEIGAGEQ